MHCLLILKFYLIAFCGLKAYYKVSRPMGNFLHCGLLLFIMLVNYSCYILKGLIYMFPSFWVTHWNSLRRIYSVLFKHIKYFIITKQIISWISHASFYYTLLKNISYSQCVNFHIIYNLYDNLFKANLYWSCYCRLNGTC